MKFKIWSLVILCIVSFNVLAQKYNGDTWSKVKSSGSGTYGIVYFQQPGVLVRSSDGKLSGLAVDILNDFVEFIQAKHGKKVTLKYVGEEVAFDKFLLAAQNNHNILCVSNIIITPERKKIMKFTPPLLPNPLVLLTHKDAPKLNSLEEIGTQLSGYTAAVISGSIHMKNVEQIKKDHMPNLKIQMYASGPVILNIIKDNPKVFSILDFPEFGDATKRGLPIKRQIVDLGPVDDIGFVMSKQSDWDEIWNEFFTDEYRKSTKYRKNVLDNLGPAYLTLLSK